MGQGLAEGSGGRASLSRSPTISVALIVRVSFRATPWRERGEANEHLTQPAIPILQCTNRHGIYGGAHEDSVKGGERQL